jgi:hypothetical protein
MNDLSVGNVVSRSFGIYAKNFVPFTLLALLMQVPVILYTMHLLSGGLQAFVEGQMIFIFVTSFGSAILSMVATAAITYGVVEELRGNHAPMSRCISVGLSRLLPVLGTALLVGLVVALGFVLLIVPGVILMCMFWLAIPSVVIEGNGGADALTRSKQLTDGYKSKIFGILFVFGLIGGIAQQVMEAVMDVSSATTPAEAMDLLRTVMIFAFLFDVIVSSLTAVANAVVYSDIRAIKEGVNTDELASVFD